MSDARPATKVDAALSGTTTVRNRPYNDVALQRSTIERTAAASPTRRPSIVQVAPLEFGRGMHCASCCSLRVHYCAQALAACAPARKGLICGRRHISWRGFQVATLAARSAALDMTDAVRLPDAAEAHGPSPRRNHAARTITRSHPERHLSRARLAACFAQVSTRHARVHDGSLACPLTPGLCGFA